MVSSSVGQYPGTAQQIVINIGELFEPQLRFCRSKKKRVGYGGARGGGKTHVLCAKAIQLALKYAGVNILVIRRSHPELQKEIVPKLLNMMASAIRDGVIKYNASNKEFRFPNGSIIVLGHYSTEANSIDYQGSNFDVIFMDEATQFTESMYRVLTLCNRLSGRVDMEKYPEFYPRMYFTCNPGGIGHLWFKKLFIDRQYNDGENPEDYEFIPCTVFENKFLMEHNPEYVNNLKALPEKERQAMLYGDWSVFQGQFFEEFDECIHTYDPMERDERNNLIYEIKTHWRIYRARDYGLDKTACYWVAMDEDGNCYVYRELWESNLAVSVSGNKINDMTPKDEIVYSDICPPDMWNRQSQTGKSAIDILMKECGQYPIKANNDRETGWLMVKEFLKVNPQTGRPRLMISKRCTHLIESLKMIQHDEKKVNDCAKEPHEVTHSCDALRYFCTSYSYSPDRIMMAKATQPYNYGRFALNMGEYESEDEDCEDDYFGLDRSLKDGGYVV